ncbi:MAG: hypothetical protein KG003_07070 [Bacteroidetes bacterium]|nr:hypothetical protein [Bacteroidota bacterium]
MKYFIVLFVWVFLKIDYIQCQDIQTTISIQKNENILGYTQYRNSGCLILTQQKTLMLYMTNQEYKQTINVDFGEAAQTYVDKPSLTTGLNLSCAYVTYTPHDFSNNRQGIMQMLYRIDSNGNKTKIGEFRTQSTQSSSHAANFCTPKYFYLIKSYLTTENDKGEKGFFSAFEIFSVAHNSNQLERKLIYFDTKNKGIIINNKTKNVAFDGFRGEELFFHLIDEDDKIPFTLWSYQPEEGVKEVFRTAIANLDQIAPHKSIKETYGGFYSANPNFTDGVQSAGKTLTSNKINVTPDPFGDGFYLFYLYDKTSRPDVVLMKSEGYKMEYYSNGGTKKWSENCEFSDELKSKKFGTQMYGQRIVHLTPLDANRVRILFNGDDYVFYGLLSNKKCPAIMDEVKISKMRFSIYGLNDRTLITEVFQPNVDQMNNYNNYIDELKPSEYDASSYIVFGANGITYQHVLVVKRKTGEMILSAYRTPYKDGLFSEE